MSGKRLIFLGMLVTVVMTALRELAQGEAPKPRHFIAPYVVFLMLSLAAELGQDAAKVAGSFALLAALGVMLANAGSLINVAAYITGSKETVPPKETVRATQSNGAPHRRRPVARTTVRHTA